MDRHQDPGPHGARLALRSGRLLTARRLSILGVLLISLTAYLITLPPGLTWAHDSADGGELAAAAFTLGVAHPPGYPTYVLLAHPFTHLTLPNVAWGSNLFSALCAALAASLVTRTVGQETQSVPAALGAGIALALSPLLWSQATVTEVHALNTLFAALLLFFASRSTRSTHPWLAPSAGLTWGLALGNHLSILFAAPLVALALRRQGKAAPLGIAATFLGAGVYAYLPLRAAANPPINWGDPRSLEGFWRVVSGTPYRHFVFALPIEHLPARLLSWLGLLARQFTPLGLPVALFGAVTLWRERRALISATLLTTILCSAFAIGYDTTDSYLYLLPALSCLALWFGMGIAALISRLAAGSPQAGRAAAILALALPLATGLIRLPQQSLRGDRSPAEFRSTTLLRAPPEAILVSQRDDHTFALWYYQHAMGERPDVAVVDSALLGYDWHAAQLLRNDDIPLQAGQLLAGPASDLARAAQLTGRPVCLIELEGTGLSCTD
jgi:hypothetical protein